MAAENCKGVSALWLEEILEKFWKPEHLMYATTIYNNGYFRIVWNFKKLGSFRDYKGTANISIFWVCSSWNINRQLRSPLQGWKLQEHRLKKENIMNLLHMTESWDQSNLLLHYTWEKKRYLHPPEPELCKMDKIFTYFPSFCMWQWSFNDLVKTLHKVQATGVMNIQT